MDSLKQSAGVQSAGSVSTLSLAYPGNVTAGSLLVVVVTTSIKVIESNQLTDNRGNVWIRKGHSQRIDLGDHETVSIWSAIVVNTGPCTVTIVPTASDTISMCVMEFPSAPWSENHVDVGHTAQQPWGGATVVAPGDLLTSVEDTIVAAMAYADTTTTITLTGGAGWIEVLNMPSGTSAMPIAVAYQIGAAGTYAVEWTLGAAKAHTSAIVAFKGG